MGNKFTGYRKVFYNIASQLGYILTFDKNINDTKATTKNGDEIKSTINPRGNIVFRDGSKSIELCNELGFISRIGSNLTIAAQKMNDSNKFLFIIKDKLQEKHIVVSIPDVAENNSDISVAIPKGVGTGKREYTTMAIKLEDGKCKVLSSKNYEGKRQEVEYNVTEYIEQIESFLKGFVKAQDNEVLKKGFELIKPVIEFQISSYLISGNLLRQVELVGNYNSKQEEYRCGLEELLSCDGDNHKSEIASLDEKMKKLDEEYYRDMEILKEQIEYLYEAYDGVFEKQKTA